MLNRLPLIVAGMLASSVVGASEKEGSLISLMGNFQYFMHKTSLSLDSGNLELVKFYAHEIEENLEKAEEYGDYQKYHIGSMVKHTLTPEFETFEAHLDKGDLNAANRQFDVMIEACNSCHQSTQKGLIRIERVKTNPFMQSFAP
jgi:hypothetical protein